MKFRTKVRSCLLAAMVLAATVPAVSQASAAGEATTGAAAARAGTGQVRVVTLITGDQVRVGARGGMTVQPGKGRKNMSYVTRRVGKQLVVVPADALALLNSGRLDERLFNVTTLLDYGYDEARKDLPLIVSYPDEYRAKSAPRLVGARAARTMPLVRAQSMRVSKVDGVTFWRGITGGKAQPRALTGAVSKVWLDGLRKPTLDESVRQIGAPTAWKAGYTGAGVKVAVLDTGIDASHPDLAGRVAAARNFTEDSDSRDVVGHGTHVASTIAGSGRAWKGQYRGVAPGAKLLDGKVCVGRECAESAMLAAMEWAAGERARVVNISLGGPDTPELDPVEQAVNTLTAKYGTLFVVAAGNYGPMPGSVDSPGSADAALTVGAVDKSNQLARFSGRGPRVGDGAIKPDVTAPGVDITAARSNDSQLGNAGEPYTTLSGTSMATPHVAGAAAILAGQHATWTPAQLKSALVASANPRLAKPNPTMSVFKQGAGRLDVARAIKQTVTAAPASLNFGLQQWPHGDDRTVTRTVSYHNHGTTGVTFKLAISTTWADGKPAPAGMFSIDKPTLRIPAGGNATATVTADTRAPGRDGTASGYLTATAAGLQVRTPLAVNKEAETHNVTVVHTTRAGQPSTDYWTMLARLDEHGDPAYDYGPPYFLREPNATVTVRVPKGRYILVSSIADLTSEGVTSALTQLVQPVIDVSRHQTVAVDARRGKLVSVTVSRPQAKHAVTGLDFITRRRAGESYRLGNGIVAMGGSQIYAAQLGGRQPVRGMSVVSSFWGDGADGVLTVDKSHVYNLAWHERDRVLTGFRRHVTEADLATVHTDYAQHATGARGSTDTFVYASGEEYPSTGYGWIFKLPLRVTEHYNADPNVRWERGFSEFLCRADDCPVYLSVASEPPVVMRAGHVSHEQWNRAVFGPAFPAPPALYPHLWATRTDDRLVAGVPLFSDGAGRAGSSAVDGGRTTLFRNGKKLAESPYDFGNFAVPKAAADYRLELRAQRGTPFSLSTQVHLDWTFRSGHVAGTTPVQLPLPVVRFTPRVDRDSTAPAGGQFTVPVAVQRQVGAVKPDITKLTVQVSYDDGRHWQTATLRPTGNTTWAAQLQHPDTNGFVSLRATATDRAGNTVDQTIIRAYQIRKKP